MSEEDFYFMENYSGLARFGIDLTTLARDKELDPVVGRKRETRELIEVLSRRRKNNAVLLGEPGVGKTAVAEGLAQKIAAAEVPLNIAYKRIISIDLSLMIAGTRYRGEFESRLRRVIDEASVNPDIILVIDEMHTLIGAGSAEGAMDAANILKPALARGELQCIGATTREEYKRYVEKDPALQRRFQPIEVPEPTIDETVEILAGLQQPYESFHSVIFTRSALQAAAELSKQFVPDRYLPDKAIDLLDQAGARANLSFSSETNESRHLELQRESITYVSALKYEALRYDFVELIEPLSDLEKAWKTDLLRAQYKKQKLDAEREQMRQVLLQAENRNRQQGFDTEDSDSEQNDKGKKQIEMKAEEVVDSMSKKRKSLTPDEARREMRKKERNRNLQIEKIRKFMQEKDYRQHDQMRDVYDIYFQKTSPYPPEMSELEREIRDTPIPEEVYTSLGFEITPDDKVYQNGEPVPEAVLNQLKDVLVYIQLESKTPEEIYEDLEARYQNYYHGHDVDMFEELRILTENARDELRFTVERLKELSKEYHTHHSRKAVRKTMAPDSIQEPFVDIELLEVLKDDSGVVIPDHIFLKICRDLVNPGESFRRKSVLTGDPEEIQELIKNNDIPGIPKIRKNDIALLIAEKTGIPLTDITEDESEKLQNLESILHERLIGQHEAVSAVANAVRRARVGIRNPNRPIASFIFCGPTGVGKTELTKTLASYMFGSEDSIVRLDMSEYMEKHNVAQLIGAPPGYVGYSEGGQLTEKVKRKPYSVVLFDEVDKAHLEVFDILLQLLDDGRLTDSQGYVVNFKNTIVILTSNVGASQIQAHLEANSNIFKDNEDELYEEEHLEAEELWNDNFAPLKEYITPNERGFGFVTPFVKELQLMDETEEEANTPVSNSFDTVYNELKEIVFNELKSYFRPEFLNRLDELIVFRQLTRKEIGQIRDLMLNDLIQRVEEKNYKLEITAQAKKRLLEVGYDPTFGARPMRRAITKYIENGIVDVLLKSQTTEELGGTIDVKNKIIIDVNTSTKQFEFKLSKEVQSENSDLLEVAD